MLDENVALHELYHQNSRLDPIAEHEMSMRLAALYEDPKRLQASRRAVKVYPYAQTLELPPAPEPSDSFVSLVSRRRSCRSFDAAPVSLAEVSFLLRYAYGVTGQLVISPEESQTLRAAPSAGALYPIEVYLAALAPGELPVGLWHYHVQAHRLERLGSEDPRPRIQSAMPAQFSLDTAPLVVVLGAAFDKATHKYGERGYRFALFDAGHVMQNLCLGVTALGLGGYAVGGFRDQELDQLLGLDGASEASLYAMVLGRPRVNGHEPAVET